MRFTTTTFLFLVTSLIASTAAAGVIRGTVWMSAEAAAAHARAAAALPDPHAQRGVSDAVIYVEQVPDRVERRLAGSRRWFFFGPAKPRVPRMVQMNRQFVPRVMAVAAGTRVEFRNLDAVYHSAFSVSAAKRFDLGKYPPGKVDTVLFDHAGVINLHCDIHPAMLGYVVVTPNHAFARPDSLGRYRLPQLPPGEYTVDVVHPRAGEIKRTVTIPNRGDLTLELPY
jgi:plastocyanin